MSLHRRNARRDAVELEIISTLKACGWSVQPLSAKDCPDLVIGKYRALTLLVEVKTGKKPLRPGQAKWHQEWKGNGPYVLRSVQDALDLNAATKP
jgi:hypothetical protein